MARIESSRSPIRLEKAEVDERILDVTARLLANHGVKATSVSMVAEACGYSKAAIFQRFGSKEKLIDAALLRCVALGHEALQQVAPLPFGLERDRTSLEVILDLSMKWPGFIALALAAVTVRDSNEFDRRLDALAEDLRAMFGIPDLQEITALDRLFRCLGALGVIAVLTLSSSHYVDERTTRQLILESSFALFASGE